MKIGFFGGSFNPPHMGHVLSLQTVQKKLGLKKVLVIPTNKNPSKIDLEGPTVEQRLEMTKKAFEGYGDQFIIDDREIKRGGVSYTVDTIRELQKEYPNDELFLILGADLFEELPTWKNFETILESVNLIVTTRPGYEVPQDKNELPSWLSKKVEEFDFNFIELKTGKNIQFITLQDVEVSSTELRKLLRIGRPVDQYLPLATESYIRENKLYRNHGQKISDYRDFAKFCAQALYDKKVIQLRAFDLAEISTTTEFAVVGSGTSTRHATSLAENVIRLAKEEFSLSPFSVEGMDEGRWIVIDYGPLMVHIFYDFVRQEYNIEDLWKKGKEMKIEEKK